MTQSKKRALISLAIWGPVAICFAALFFGMGGPATYAKDKWRIFYSALIIAVGFLLYLTMLVRTRVGPADKPLASDERDEHIARRSNSTALVVVLVYVFFTCIVLWEAYRERQAVPVGWMWFLAYSSAFCGYLSHAVGTLILNSKMGGHAES